MRSKRKGLRGVVPGPQERPDYPYWNTSWRSRKSLANKEVARITAEVAEYDKRRFSTGRRFQLVKNFCGIPAGTCCTVVDTWPYTTIRWDKWSKDGYGSLRNEVSMNFELDNHLQYVGEVGEK
jgi:hypothetical protein